MSDRHLTTALAPTAPMRRGRRVHAAAPALAWHAAAGTAKRRCLTGANNGFRQSRDSTMETDV